MVSIFDIQSKKLTKIAIIEDKTTKVISTAFSICLGKDFF